MAKKDKFRQMQQDGTIGSFQDMVTQATAVAAVERQASGQPTQEAQQSGGGEKVQNAEANSSLFILHSSLRAEPFRFMRLPNPQIPITEYNLVTRYCEQFSNMTRQDFVELAIIEKLHTDGLLSDDDFTVRRDEIRNRPPRGHRKGTKNTAK